MSGGGGPRSGSEGVQRDCAAIKQYRIVEVFFGSYPLRLRVFSKL